MGRRLCVNARRYRAAWLAECSLLFLLGVGSKVGDSEGLSWVRIPVFFVCAALLGFIGVMVFWPMGGCHD